VTTFQRRSEVGLRAPLSRPRIPGPIRGTAAHWNGPAMGLAGKPHSACQAAWRGIQSFHMNANGWHDVAYSLAVCHHNIVMEGRGVGVRTAANGTNVANDTWYAIFFMVGGNEEPSKGMLTAAEYGARVILGASRWSRHSDHKSTTCAGTVNKHIRDGKLVGASADSSPPPAPEEPDMSQYGPENWDKADKQEFARLVDARLNNAQVKNSDPERNFAWFQRRIERLTTATLQNVNALARVIEAQGEVDKEALAKAIAAELGEELEEIGRAAGKAVAEVTAADVVRRHAEALIAGIGDN
jgi:hypothetical protein